MEYFEQAKWPPAKHWNEDVSISDPKLDVEKKVDVLAVSLDEGKFPERQKRLMIISKGHEHWKSTYCHAQPGIAPSWQNRAVGLGGILRVQIPCKGRFGGVPRGAGKGTPANQPYAGYSSPSCIYHTFPLVPSRTGHIHHRLYRTTCCNSCRPHTCKGRRGGRFLPEWTESSETFKQMLKETLSEDGISYLVFL